MEDEERIIHPTAIVHKNAFIGKGSTISSGCVIYEGCVIGDNVFIGHNTILQKNTIVGYKSYIGGLVNCEGDVIIGRFCGINAQCHLTKYMTIDDYTFFGPMVCTTNDRYINYRREGHGTNLKGPTIGKGVRVGAMSLLINGITISDNAFISGSSVVSKNVNEREIIRGINEVVGYVPENECINCI